MWFLCVGAVVLLALVPFVGGWAAVAFVALVGVVAVACCLPMLLYMRFRSRAPRGNGRPRLS